MREESEKRDRRMWNRRRRSDRRRRRRRCNPDLRHDRVPGVVSLTAQTSTRVP